MLSEVEGLKAREQTMKAESEMRMRELNTQAELLASQKAVVSRDAQSAVREHAIALEKGQAELAASEREQRQVHQHKMLELQRKQNEIDEQLALVHSERDRNATALARANLNREQLVSAQEALHEKDEEIARLQSEKRMMTHQMPALKEGRNGMQIRLQETEAALTAANKRSAALMQSLTDVEASAAARQQESASLLQSSAAALRSKTREIEGLNAAHQKEREAGARADAPCGRGAGEGLRADGRGACRVRLTLRGGGGGGEGARPNRR